LRLLPCFVLAIILVTPIGMAGNAFAQQIAIETSADDQDSRFFGEGVLQVVLTDPNADDDNSIEEIQVDINADPDSGSSDSTSVTVPETGDSSGRFEFFLVHIDATALGPNDLDPDNSAGVEGDGMCAADCAPFITFGPGGNLDIQSDLYEKATFEIMAGNSEADVNYEETSSVLKLDRDSYGTNSYVYISIVDQDANLNPFENDEFTVEPDNDPNSDLLALDGGTLEGVMIFRETGDTTAIFEGRYRLGMSMNAESESLVLTLFDKANYDATLAAPENDSNDTDEISFTVGNSDGTIDIGGSQQIEPTRDPVISTDKESYAIGESVHVTITDQDANVNSSTADSVQIQVLSGRSQVEISALESAANTGVFMADFQLAEHTDTESGTISPGGTATITYTDERPADYFDKVEAGQNPKKDFAVEIDIQLPVRTGVESTELTAPEIVVADGSSGPYRVGTSLTLSTTLANNNDQLQPFVVLIEVRDNNGVTVFLALQSGVLDPSGTRDVGLLWQPNQAGTFEVRTFAITSVSGEADLLSSPAKSEFIVA
jgi:hypothetical protein